MPRPIDRPSDTLVPPLLPDTMSERRTSIIGALLVAIGPISMALYTPAMPTLVEEFATSEAMVKLTLAIYFAGFAFTQLLCGPLSDAYGRRRITVVFMGIYLLGALVAVVAPTIEWLLAARLLQGIGASVGVATSRAIVRDQFVGETSARIMNTIGIVLDLSGWHAIFVVMVFFGLGVIGVTLASMRETTIPDPRLIHPRALLASYCRILASRRFVSTSLTLGGSVGALYTLATVLPFVLIDRAGLTPTQYGLGMLAQSGLFFLGSVTMRALIGKVSAYRLVLPGLCFIGAGSLALALSITLLPLSYLSIMVPVGLYAFGIAFVMPAMTTSALSQYPDIAGAAAAMLGFVQMGMGLLGGLACAAIGEPVTATAIVIPTLGAIAIAAYGVFAALKPLATETPREPGGVIAAPEALPPDR